MSAIPSWTPSSGNGKGLTFSFSVFSVFILAAAALMLFLGEFVSLFMLPVIPLAGGAIFVWLWRRARRSGERWFQFEE